MEGRALKGDKLSDMLGQVGFCPPYISHLVGPVHVAAQVEQQPHHLGVPLPPRPDERAVAGPVRRVQEVDGGAARACRPVGQGPHDVRPAAPRGHVHQSLALGVGPPQEGGGGRGDEGEDGGGVGVVEGAEEGREAQVLKGRKEGRPVA